jgi:hypothetical protein
LKSGPRFLRVYTIVEGIEGEKCFVANAVAN